MNKPIIRSIYSLLSLISILCSFAFYPIKDVACAETTVSAKQRAEVENWIGERLASGEIANLETRFSNRNQRILSTEYLKNLFTRIISGDVSAPAGIRIANAIFLEPIKIVETVIPHRVDLTHCEFKDDLIFSKCRFKRTMSFEASLMKNVDFNQVYFEGEAIFDEIKIDGIADFRETQFFGPVSFKRSRILRLDAKNTKFRHLGVGAAFDGIRVADMADFSHSVFEGPMSLQNSDIRLLIAIDAKFNTIDGEANFKSIKITDSLLLNNARFEGSVYFTGSDIRIIEAGQTRFVNPRSHAIFEDINVGDRAAFDGALFAGAASFRGAAMSSFQASNARFSNPRKGVFFDKMVIKSTANLYRAVFAGPVSFIDAEIIGRFEATGCEFLNEKANSFFIGIKVGDNVFINHATFNGSVYFNGAELNYFEASNCRFMNPDGRVIFENMKVGNIAIFNNAEFHGSVSFNSAEISRFDALNVRFLNPREGVFASGMRVAGFARFNSALFAGPVYFHDLDIGGRLEALDAKFTSESASAFFTGIRVRDSAIFTFATFNCPADFRGAQIRYFEATWVKFHRSMDFSGSEIRHFNASDSLFKGAKVQFDSMKVDDCANFERAIFQGEVSFTALETRRFKAGLIRFLNYEKTIKFDGIKVEDNADFNDAIFEGTVTFESSEIGRLNAQRAEFKNPQQAAFFNGIRVRGYARFNQASFSGQVLFTNAQIAGSLEAYAIKCVSENGILIFDRMKVAGNADFIKAQFSNSVYFQGVEIGLLRAVGISFNRPTTPVGEAISSSRMYLTNGTFQEVQINGINGSAPASISQLDLTGSVTSGELKIMGFNIGVLEADSLRVDGRMSLEGIAIENSISLRNSKLSMLNLTDIGLVSTSHDSRPLDIEGMKFQHIQVQNQAEGLGQVTYDNLKNLVDKSISAYANLENLYEKLGERKYQQYADEMFFERKSLELEEEEDLIVRTGHRVWYYLAGYGRRPWFTVSWILLFCMIGCLVFRKSSWMVKEEDKNPLHRYNCLWYSFDLFIPFIDLHSANLWVPRDDRRFSKIYMRIHRIMGWVLIPVLLATLTGIAK